MGGKRGDVKMLILMRHADAVPGGPALDDADRPLSPAGLRDASRMGRYLRARILVPDLVLCSSALRARQTFDALAPEFAGALTLRIDPALYLASADRLLAAIRGAPGATARLMIVGHNPGIAALAQALCAPGDASRVGGFAAAALAALEFAAAPWSAVAPAAGHLTHFATPRDVPA